MKAHDKLRNIADIVVSPRIFAIGIMAKDPVTSSRFSNRIITKQVGKIMAPTMTSTVCVAVVNADVVANPRRDPEIADFMRIFLMERSALVFPAVAII